MNEITRHICTMWHFDSDGILPHLTLKMYDPSLWAIVLAPSLENYTKIASMPLFGEIFTTVTEVAPQDKQSIAKAQVLILEAMQEDVTCKEAVMHHLAALNEAKVISSAHQAYMKEALLHVKPAPSLASSVIPPEEAFDFKAQKAQLLAYLEKAKRTLFEDEALLLKAEEIETKLQHTTFSIGITGVMNAGKSTFLNALLGQELLGTSTVPETANLTIIKHAAVPKARVHFWSAAEWAQIETSAKMSTPMAHFVANTKATFEHEWSAYVREVGVQKEIAPDTLKYYTSAKLSKGRCNLVKCVELYTDVALAQEGIDIVDTPGLDDPVVQREEITKQYLAQCDVMLHCMNASQSATQKDVDFIIDALTYQRISKLVLLITRVDTLRDEELQEVMAYTKKSITAQLDRLGKGHLSASLLEKITLFPLAGEYALWHRTGKGNAALAKGYDEEKTGIVAIEEHLHEALFGPTSERAGLMIAANAKAIRLACEQQIAQFSTKRKNLDTSKAQLQEKQRDMQAQDVWGKLSALETKVEELHGELRHYLSTMEQSAKRRFTTLRTELARRLSDDIAYTLKKEKRFPEASRLDTMIYTAIKDGMVDCLREYRLGLYQHINAHQEALAQEFPNDIVLWPFDPKAYQDEAAKSGLLSVNHSLLSETICAKVTKASKRNTAPLLEHIEADVSTAYRHIEHQSLPKLREVGVGMIAQFYDALTEPIKALKATVKAEAKALEEALQLAGSEQASLEMYKTTLKQKETELLHIVRACQAWEQYA